MPPHDLPQLHNAPPPPSDSPKLMSKEERKRAEKMEKERKKREKEEEKRRKKELEKERKRSEKEKKKKGKEEIKKEWNEAVAVAESGPAVVMETESRPIKRMSSFEDHKSDKVPQEEDVDDEGSDKGEVNSTKVDEGDTISDLDEDEHAKENKEGKESYNNEAFTGTDAVIEQLKARIGEEVTL